MASADPLIAAFEHQFIIWIGELRSPLVIDPHGLHESCEIAHGCIKLRIGELVDRTLLRPGEYRLVLKEQRWCGERNEAPVLQQAEQSVARS